VQDPERAKGVRARSVLGGQEVDDARTEAANGRVQRQESDSGGASNATVPNLIFQDRSVG
jgi:hypothetical protein